MSETHPRLKDRARGAPVPAGGGGAGRRHPAPGRRPGGRSARHRRRDDRRAPRVADRHGRGGPRGATRPATIAPFSTYGRDPGLRLWFRRRRGGRRGMGVVGGHRDARGGPAGRPGDACGGRRGGARDRRGPDAHPHPATGWCWPRPSPGASGPEGTWAWHLVVPDRTLPAQIQAPDLVLFGGGRHRRRRTGQRLLPGHLRRHRGAASGRLPAAHRAWSGRMSRSR